VTINVKHVKILQANVPNVLMEEMKLQTVNVHLINMNTKINHVKIVISSVLHVRMIKNVLNVKEIDQQHQTVLVHLDIMRHLMKIVINVHINVKPVSKQIRIVLNVLETESKNQHVIVKPDIIMLKEKHIVQNVMKNVTLVLKNQTNVKFVLKEEKNHQVVLQFHQELNPLKLNPFQ